MQSERQHKEYSPSRAERFFLCPGSVNLLKRTPPCQPSPYQEEGVKAHDVLEAGLQNSCSTATAAINMSIHCAEDFNTDFKSSINDALDYVWSVMADYYDAEMWIETYVDPPVASAPGEAGGFCDIAIYSASARELFVIDYKHGAGIAKAALGNTQVRQYAAGFLFGPEAKVKPEDVDKVTLVIIQPRAFHPEGEIRTYEMTPSQVGDYLFELDFAIEECVKEDAPLNPGIDQCRFCDARSTCPALEARALKIAGQYEYIKQVNLTKLPDPVTLDTTRLSYIKQGEPLWTLWMNSIDARIEELLRAGQAVPNYKMVETQARRHWFGKPEDLAARLSSLTGQQPEEFMPRKLINITDAEKVVVAAFKARVGHKRKKQASEEAKQFFAYFTTKESSGNLTLVEASDPRPAMNKSMQAFSGIAGLIQPPTIER